MIENFEEETFSLTEKEIEIAKQLADVLKRDNPHVPKTLDFICERLTKVYGGTFSKARVGKMIAYIRQQGLVIGLCSTNKGYFIYATIEEFESTVRSLADRLRSQIATYKAMDKQLKELKNGKAGSN